MNLPENIDIGSPTTLIIGVGIFLAILVLAHMSRTYLEWSMSGAGLGYLAGVLTIVGIGVFIFKFNNGVIVKTLVGKYSNVLGAKVEVTPENLNTYYDQLEEGKKETVKSHICTPEVSE